MHERALHRDDQSHALLRIAVFAEHSGKWPRVRSPSRAALMVLRTTNIEGRSTVHVEAPLSALRPFEHPMLALDPSSFTTRHVAPAIGILGGSP